MTYPFCDRCNSKRSGIYEVMENWEMIWLCKKHYREFRAEEDKAFSNLMKGWNIKLVTGKRKGKPKN